MHKVPRPLTDIIKETRQIIKASGLTQQELSSACGVNQSTISRFLKEDYFPKNRSRGLMKICKYANCKMHINVEGDPRENDELMNAIGSIWNGSEHHAKVIARMIKEVGRLSQY